MKRLLGITVGLLVCLSFTTPSRGADPTNIGAKKCKVCHMSKKQGAQYKVWEASKHAGAYATLATPEAKTAATKAGVSGDPQKSEACLKCHGALAGVDAKMIAASYDVALGVQCESCHGAGSAHVDNMRQRMKTKDMSIPTAQTKVEANEAFCVTCHNADSPTYKAFNFEESWKQIAHPLPE